MALGLPRFSSRARAAGLRVLRGHLFFFQDLGEAESEAFFDLALDAV
jgi:hypothetical protein